MSCSCNADDYPRIFGGVEAVLAVFAHPDDMEINCGGLVARLAGDGKRVRLVCMTAGECGIRQSRRPVEEFGLERRRATHEAAKTLGIEATVLDTPDGQVQNDLNTIASVVAEIRRWRPDIVITHEPRDFVHTVDGSYYYVNHRDHRHTATVTFDAVYPYSRDAAFFPEQLHEDGLDCHVVRTIAFGDGFDSPLARSFDVSSHLEMKTDALRAHRLTGAIPEEEFESYLGEGLCPHGNTFETLAVVEDLH